MKFELQKADFWKRLSALMFDSMMLILATVGLFALFSLFFDYSEHYETIEALEQEYSEKYDINLNITKEEYENLPAAEKSRFDTAEAEYAADERAIYAYEKTTEHVEISIWLALISILLSFVIFELVIPIIFKHGRTLGKKIFGLAVIRTGGFKLGGQAHFIRSMVGKYAMETMVPICILVLIVFGNMGLFGTFLLVGCLALEIGVYLTTATRSTIHDLVSDTVVVDMASQMIFESEEELIEYKTRLHEEMANKQEY